MSNWTMSIKNSANNYVSDGTIQRPNEDMETQKISTTQRINMADGSTAFVTPSTKSRSEPFTMFFADTTSAFRTKIQTYIDNSDDVKITTHTSEVFTGKFTVIKRVWFSGQADTYDVMTTFTRTYNSE